VASRRARCSGVYKPGGVFNPEEPERVIQTLLRYSPGHFSQLGRYCQFKLTSYFNYILRVFTSHVAQ
jgi:hypothetical protein